MSDITLWQGGGQSLRAIERVSRTEMRAAEARAAVAATKLETAAAYANSGIQLTGFLARVATQEATATPAAAPALEMIIRSFGSSVALTTQSLLR